MTVFRIVLATLGALLALDFEARAGTVKYAQPLVYFDGDDDANTVTVNRSDSITVSFQDTTGTTTIDASATTSAAAAGAARRSTCSSRTRSRARP